MKNTVNKIRIENYAKEKAEIDQNTTLQFSSAYAKYLLEKEFITDFNTQSSPMSIPNAIMIEGQNRKENKSNIKWLIGKTNANYIHIDSNNENNEVKLNQLLTALESAQETFRKTGKRTILWDEDFANLLVNNEENEDIIGDLKDMLCKLSSEYKTTLIFDTETSKGLDPIALQNHRVKVKLNLNKDIKPEELNKLQKEFLKSNIFQIKNSDGYRLQYLPTGKDFVDIYLGAFGYNPNTLWVDSNESKKINPVLNNLDIIKDIDKFKTIKNVQFTEPDKIGEISQPIYDTNKVTKSGEKIYEYKI